MKQILKYQFATLGLVGLMFSILIFQSCGGKSEENTTDKTTYTDTVSVETQSVEVKELTISKTFSGTLEGEDQANIIAKIPERIMKVNTKVGDYVKVGDVLFELDKGGAQSQFYQAQAAFLNAQKNFERMQNLLKVGAVSQQAFDATQTQYEVAKANFDAARSTVEITSPLSGIVTAINVNIGDLANPAMPLATVANIGRMKAKFNVGEIDVPSFYVGQPAEIYSEMSPDIIQTGKVFQISKSANVQSRTFEMQAMFSNTNDRWFKPGMFCRVRVNMKSKKNALTIPYSSVYKENDTDGVYVVNDNKALYKPITTGLTDGKLIEVTSGLKTGEQVVTLGMSNLKDGTVVIISNK
ncbi:MAG: efflux RND transporter periplasmic adaptor subunit [Ignavibacteriaceae bacterium]|jgi:RND family efflux transporter MFP subunit|nr:efflux RND transporter periplasmic adaptor subunit [Chlorobium sp.]MCW8817755.1 efflux RND transporter periplasmic adaptor subunit [Ignavibacteriaceae bacterium]MCW8824493.1 efflux RND transporter periplasmic adaptor subunit [Ignavibacteriaceae bacterium]MCW8961159.1 efflux RND transporter periplasmic adaptor subunit [Ignavibacteriaceae bacterium]MCW9097095.1 efflux RND transporter periplasmic adaptor subunit [Ignavibacteriaceae bacterium]